MGRVTEMWLPVGTGSTRISPPAASIRARWEVMPIWPC